MKSHPLLPLLAAGLLCGLPVFGQTSVRPGVHIELITNGPAFPEPSTSTAGAKAKAALDSFAATASITNRSKTGLGVRFATAAVADARIVFTLTNAAGQELWRSTETAADQEPAEKLLKPRATWRRTVRVPLVIDDTPLAAGRYRLTATCGNDGLATVSTTFVVPGAEPEPLPAAFMLSGYVLSGGYTFQNGVAISYQLPIEDTYVEIWDGNPYAQSPRVWNGFIDSNGKFAGTIAPANPYVLARWYIPHDGPSSPDMMPWSDDRDLGPRDKIRGYPVLTLNTSSFTQRVQDVKTVRVSPVEGYPDRMLVEADVMLGLADQRLMLRAREITFGGVLVFDAVQHPPPAITGLELSGPVTMRAFVPRFPGVYKVRVQAQESTREAMVAASAE